MTMSDLERRLAHIEALLERLVVPVAAEEARQLVTASPEQRKAHNKAVLARAKARAKGVAA
jgi:hypothetical protein